MKRRPEVHGIVTLPYYLYVYLCDTSFERVDKLPHNHPEVTQHKRMLRDLEMAFRNTQWEET